MGYVTLYMKIRHLDDIHHMCLTLLDNDASLYIYVC